MGQPRVDGAALDIALAAARRRDTRGFTALYRLLAGEVAAFCRARGAPDVDALTNDVFLGAFRWLAEFEGDGASFRAYVYRIARNKLFDDRRSRTRASSRRADWPTQDPTSPDRSVEDRVLGDLDREAIESALALLSDAQREIVLLRFLAELSIRETADITGRAETAVKALQRRALASLRREFLSSGGIPGASYTDSRG